MGTNIGPHRTYIISILYSSYKTYTIISIGICISPSLSAISFNNCSSEDIWLCPIDKVFRGDLFTSHWEIFQVITFRMIPLTLVWWGKLVLLFDEGIRFGKSLSIWNALWNSLKEIVIQLLFWRRLAANGIKFWLLFWI